MKDLDWRALRTFFLATVAGAALHFLYAVLPNWLTAFLAPVNESLWEHGKLIFWPALAVLWLERDERRTERRACLLLAVAGMLAAGWIYHGMLCGTGLMFDIMLYVAMMAVALLLPGRLSLGKRWRLPLIVLTALLGAAFLLFTLLPPNCALFSDPALAGVWYRLPC